MSDSSVYGLIGLTEESVGLDRRIYTGLTSTDPTLAVSYNSGRVDVFLNGVKLVGNHSEMPSGTKDYTFTATGQGSSITLATGVALVSSDVVEVMGYVSNSANTVTTYNYTASDGDTAFTANNSSGDLVNVFLNGVLLDSSDYNLTTANTVTLGSGAAASDIVHIQVIGALDNSNFVPAGGGTFSGNVTVPNLVIGDGGNIGSESDNDALTIDSSGNVNVNQKLVFQVGSTRAIAQNRNGSISNILWKDTTATDNLNLFNPNASNLKLGTGNTERLRIDSSGNVELKTTNADLILPSGGGIDFNGDVLEFESGTWTPSLGGNTNYTNRSGSYTKIGNLVYVRGFIEVNTLGTGSNRRISGLPFTSESPASGGYSATLGVSYYDNSATSVVFVTVAVSTTNADVHYNTGATTALTYNGTFFGNSTRIDFSGCYRI